MMSSRAAPPIKEEGANVDGAVEAGGMAVPDHLKRSCALLRLTVAASSMAHMTWKWLETGKGTKNGVESS